MVSSLDAFKAYLDHLPTWANRAQLLSGALDLLPVGAVVGPYHRVKDSGLDWECRWTSSRRWRDRSVVARGAASDRALRAPLHRTRRRSQDTNEATHLLTGLKHGRRSRLCVAAQPSL
jgi:hypothetical protein